MPSEHLASQVWLPTGKLKNEKSADFLAEKASKALEHSESGLFEGFQARERMWQYDLDYPLDALEDAEDTTDYIDEQAESYLGSAFFKRLSADDQIRAVRALKSEDIQWRGSYALNTEGLWSEYSHSTEVRGGELSRFVLSGLFGAELLKDNKKLNYLASHFEENLLKRAILVGSASLAASRGILGVFDEVGHYTTSTSDASRTTTYIGGDMHGDFMSLRYAQLMGEVRDNATGYDHAFAPTYDLVRVSAYHSVEPRITQALLQYLIVHKGEKPRTLRSRLLQRITDRDAQIDNRFGAFGDFDTHDGFSEALAVYHMVRKERANSEPNISLASLIVGPASDRRLELLAEADGVRFFTTNVNDAKVAYTVPVDEIEDYIVNLACAVGGRVTPRAHVNIIKALDGSRPDDGVAINPFLPQ